MKQESQKEKIIQYIEEKLTRRSVNNICLTTAAKEMKISKRTIYEIFGSKDEIFENIVVRILVKVKNKNNEIIDKVKNNEINIYTAIEEFIKFAFTNKHIAHSKIFEKNFKYFEEFKKENLEFLETLIAIANKRKILREDFNKRIFYMILYSIMHTIMVKYGFVDNVDEISEITETLCYGIFSSETQEKRYDII